MNISKFTVNREKIRNDRKSQLIICAILFLILFIPNIFTFLYATDLENNPVMLASYVILSLFAWLFPLLFLNVKNFFRLGIFFFLLSPIEIGFVKSTGLPVNVGIMDTVLSTNWQETKEQLTSNFPALIFFILILIVYCFLLTFVGKNKLSLKFKIGYIAVFIFINAVLFYKMFSLSGNYIPVKDRISAATENTLKKYKKIFPADILINTYDAIDKRNQNKNFEKEVADFSFGAKQKSPNQEEETFILVIGETARRHNFHLYGYSRETTPELEKIKNLTPFSDVNSCGTLTLLSLPQIITRANPDNFDLQFKEKTIVDLFHEAGYYTAWIGVQNISAPIVKRLKTVTDYTYFSQSDISSGHFFDTDILKNIQQVLNDKKHKKKFIVIHTLGSHFRYSNRYPDNFEKFKPNISKSGYSNIGPEYKNELVNSYDNSILFTDYFLSSVIKELEKTNSVSGMIYLSDHGENLYDDGKSIFHGGEKPTPYEYEIPYIVWYSQKFHDFYPEKSEALQNNKNKKASSTATFYTLSDMADIMYRNSEAEKKKSLADPDYQEPEKRKIYTSKGEVISVK